MGITVVLEMMNDDVFTGNNSRTIMMVTVLVESDRSNKRDWRERSLV